MTYSRRVAYWLIAVCCQLVQACVGCGRWEIISIWLLFVKMLKATAGVRRTKHIELNEGKSTTVNQQKLQKQSQTVTMETTRFSDISDLTDCKMDSVYTDNQKSQFSDEEEECFSGFFTKSQEHRSNPQEVRDGPETGGISFELYSSGESDGSKDSQEGILVKAKQQEETKRTQSQTLKSQGSFKNEQPEKEMDKMFGVDNEMVANQSKTKENAQESPVLEQHTNGLDISEIPAKNREDLEEDEMSDCLVVEMAFVSSDSDAEENWKSLVASDMVNENIEESRELEINHFGMSKFEVNSDGQAKQVYGAGSEPISEQHDAIMALNITQNEIIEQPQRPTECELQEISLDSSIHYCSLSKIAEDEGEFVKTTTQNLQRLSCSTSELDKKVPQDFCVIQDIKSENVSTEHLDFRMARLQWQKIEEQIKGQIQNQMVRQGSCQGCHSFMYTPVRNIERQRRVQDTDSLAQFSHCSEDSGLDDISYRSTYEEPENAVEREIREALEREENFRRERAMASATQGKSRPNVLHHSKSEPGVKAKMSDTQDNRSKFQTSFSFRTPTMSISASTEKSPTYHEMTANNVIILEPDSYPPIPRVKEKRDMLSPGTGSLQEWQSDINNIIILETSNLIIRSASEFCLSTACRDTQDSTFQNNPFFKLRSHSTQSLVDQEIKLVRQREEELRRQRARLYVKERYDTVLVSPNQLKNFTYERSEKMTKSKSSPSSPSKTRKMDHSTLSCEQKFTGSDNRPRRKSVLVQRWEAGIFANHQEED